MRAPTFAAQGMALLAWGVFSISVPPPSLLPAERTDPQAAWARVLREFVDAEGHIDFARLKAQPHDLFVYVAYVADVSPRSTPAAFPVGSARLAYYVNAYNALAMYNVITQSVEPKDKVRFFYLRKLRMGGEERSLSALENDIIRPLGDPRVHFALNCMVRGCPRLPREPFRASDLNTQLEAQATEFLNDPAKVRVLPLEKRAVLSKILDWYKDDFLKKAPTLREFINRYRREPVPSEDALEFADYDWTLNRPMAPARP